MGKVMSGIPKPSYYHDFPMRNHSYRNLYPLPFVVSHWCPLGSCGGVKPSLVYVDTDEDAHGVKEKREKVSPEDFFVTMTYAMRLDYNKKYLSLDKREYSMNNQGKGTPLSRSLRLADFSAYF